MNHRAFPNLSSEAIGALRSTSLTDQNKIGDITFIRCGRRLGPGVARRLADHIREVTGDGVHQVTDAHNPDFAEHDYIRVSTDSATYRLICALKS